MSKAPNKDTRLIFRVSPHEKAAVAAKARRAKTTVSDFCRRAVLEKPVVFIEGLPDYVNLLYRISNNINQITIAHHQGRDISPTLPAIQARLVQSLDMIDCVIGGDEHSDCQAD